MTEVDKFSRVSYSYIHILTFSPRKSTGFSCLQWFGKYQDGTTGKILSLFETKLYTEDRLGLQAMNSTGRLHFLSTVGDHLQVDESWLIKNVINVFLK